MPALIWFVIVAVILMFIFWPAFRNFVIDQITDLWTIIIGVTRIYAIVAFVTLTVASILILVALFVPSSTFKGIAFLLSIALLMLTWLPLGLILRIFGANSAVFPRKLRAFTAWLCFVGFLGVLFPEISSDPMVMMVILLAAGVLAGASSKWDALNKLVIPLTIILFLAAGWKYIDPDGFRSATRFTGSVHKAVVTKADRFSFGNETYAAGTFGKLKRNTSVLYIAQMNQNDSISDLGKVNVNLNKGSIVLLCNQKSKIKFFQGQGFAEVRLADSDGSFVHGRTYWIESNLLEIGTMNKLAEKSSEQSNDPGYKQNPTSALGPGTYTFNLKKGESRIVEIQCGNHYGFRSPKAQFTVFYKDHAPVNSWDSGNWPALGWLNISQLGDEPIVLKVMS
ncbi:MAG: hypothetical protein NTX66_02110 [Candidatus Falkowbacteria bacterium]|nr:hypothetical protein [Candidatus Falkowbacteria bacterium]